MTARSRSLALLLAPLLVLTALGVQECRQPARLDWTILPLGPGPDLEFRLRAAFFSAKPGTIIELPEGTYSFRGGLTLETSHIVVRGQGPGRTFLDFTDQLSGAQAILARGDQVTFERFTILNPAGDGIKTEFVDGATFRHVKIEWTRGSHPDNGDYGIYPAQNKNVLIDGCTVMGARDAGIYLGQSENAIIRNSYAAFNVLGIEVENSINSDVYNNVATANTAGIAVFNLPRLPVTGHGARVFDNTVVANNEPNFAAGGILRDVPGGTGIVVIGAKGLDVFGNRIADNGTANLFISGFNLAVLAGNRIDDATYDPYAQGIRVWDNEMFGGGTAAQGDASSGTLGFLLGILFGSASQPIPDITIGGYYNEALIPGGLDPNNLPGAQQLPIDERICIWDNGSATFASLDGPPNQTQVWLDPGVVDCGPNPPMEMAVTLDPPTDPPVVVEPTPQEIAAACGGGGGGINWGAVEYNCPNLSDWGLFPNGPLGDPAAGGVPFDLINSLHSDYALKRRVAFVPPGEMASYRPNDPMDFPDDTIIAKTFYFEQPGNAQRIVETRLLIRRSYGWEGLPYIWNGAETEAALALGGGIETLTLLDRDGDPHTTDYEIPGAADCGSCHFGTGGDLPIGPKARNLNHDFDYGGGLVENQLLHWELAGILQGSPGAGAAPRAADAFVPASGTLDERARAYLDVNCMHCHNPLGRAGFTGMWLEPDRPFGPETGKCKTPVAAGSASLGLEYDIVPGDADMSILVKRLDSVAPSIKMPELAKSIVHDEGVALITDWVDNFLSGGCNNP